MMPHQEIPLARLFQREDVSPRGLDTKKVDAIAASIEMVGLLSPIIARPVTRYVSGILADAWEVLAGHHRVEAFRRLKRDSISAFVAETDDLRAELVAIDENLCRSELTPAQEIAATTRRKAIYEVLHPETVVGAGTGGRARRTKDDLVRDTKSKDVPPAERFTLDTAKKTGKSESKIKKDNARGEALGDAALSKVERTSLDKIEEIDALVELPPEERETLIDRAAAGENVSAKAVLKGARSIMASRNEPDDSLDYFPTPPYAIRALFERVLAHMGVHSVGQVWEPACGEGHMTAVIEEYAKGTVVGTDIFDYSREGRMPPAWLRTLDFLDPAETTPVTDWIITNPPFGGKTEEFVLRALDLAEVGVAIFVRLQWLETIGRYEAIFRDRPPTLIAFFCERVNLCKGRWEPDGSTATAYIWLVWMRDHMPMAPFWIPPGCRKDLSRETDRERFTAHPVVCPPREALNGGVQPSPAAVAADTPSPTASALPPGPDVAEAALRFSTATLADGAASGSRPELAGEDIPHFLRVGHPDNINWRKGTS